MTTRKRLFLITIGTILLVIVVWVALPFNWAIMTTSKVTAPAGGDFTLSMVTHADQKESDCMRTKSIRIATDSVEGQIIKVYNTNWDVIVQDLILPTFGSPIERITQVKQEMSQRAVGIISYDSWNYISSIWDGDTPQRLGDSWLEPITGFTCWVGQASDLAWLKLPSRLDSYWEVFPSTPPGTYKLTVTDPFGKPHALSLTVTKPISDNDYKWSIK